MRERRTPDGAAIQIAFQWEDDASDIGVIASGGDETGLLQHGERIAQLREPASQTAARCIADSHMLNHFGRVETALVQIDDRVVIALQLNAVEIDDGIQQGRQTAPLSQ
jgi:hypothetical protein